MSSPSTKKRTIGEELWEVHLHRVGVDDTVDDDLENLEKHPKRSLGEELWQVHLRRSQGIEPDYDQDTNQAQPTDGNDSKKAETCEENVMQLRNRTVSIQSH
jgi:nucleotidyltransferase/DNA polymerase involved in DNA repair